MVPKCGDFRPGTRGWCRREREDYGQSEKREWEGTSQVKC